MRWYWGLGFQQDVILGCQLEITAQEIKSKYESLKKLNDLRPSQIAEIDAAYAVLGNVTRRSKYDACMQRHITEAQIDRHRLVAERLNSKRKDTSYFQYLLENVLHGQGFEPKKLQKAVEKLGIKSLDLSCPWLVIILNSQCNPKIQFKLAYFFWQQFKFAFNAEHLDLINANGLASYFFEQYQLDALLMCLKYQHRRILSKLTSQLKEVIFSRADAASLVFKAWLDSEIEREDLVEKSFSVLVSWGLKPSYELLLEALAKKEKYFHLKILSKYMYLSLTDIQIDEFLKKAIHCNSHDSLSNIFLGMFNLGLRGLTAALLIEANKAESYSCQGRCFLYAVAQGLNWHPDTPGDEFMSVLKWCEALERPYEPHSLLRIAATHVLKTRTLPAASSTPVQLPGDSSMISEPAKYSGSKRADAMSTTPAGFFYFYAHSSASPTRAMSPPRCIRSRSVKRTKANDSDNRNSGHNIKPPSP